MCIRLLHFLDFREDSCMVDPPDLKHYVLLEQHPGEQQINIHLNMSSLKTASYAGPEECNRGKIRPLSVLALITMILFDNGYL